MADPEPTRSRTDPILLIEVLLIAAFLILLVLLYLVPAVSDEPFQPGIWRWVVVAAPFFGAVLLETLRRRRRRKQAIRDVIRDFPERSGDRRPG